MVSLATFNATFLGTSSPAQTARYMRDGTNKVVTINIPETRFTNTGASTSAFLTSNFPIPAEIRPDIFQPVSSWVVHYYRVVLLLYILQGRLHSLLVMVLIHL